MLSLHQRRLYFCKAQSFPAISYTDVDSHSKLPNTHVEIQLRWANFDGHFAGLSARRRSVRFVLTLPSCAYCLPSTVHANTVVRYGWRTNFHSTLHVSYDGRRDGKNLKASSVCILPPRSLFVAHSNEMLLYLSAFIDRSLFLPTSYPLSPYLLISIASTLSYSQQIVQ